MWTKPIISYDPFSKNDTNIIKGVAMLMIMFHNFFHLIPPLIGENEFVFSDGHFKKYIHLINRYPDDFIRFTSSYFGHYGVQLFIFISSYGLYLGYRERKIKWLNFMKKRILKLYPTLLLGIFLIMTIWLLRAQLPGITDLKSVILKLTLLYGFLPNEALSLSGPWWFFSAIVQLYALFPLLVWLLHKKGTEILLIITLIFIVLSLVLDVFVHMPGTSVYFTFIGQMPVFTMGLYFAAKPKIHISKSILILSIIIFALGNINKYIWYFSFVAITIILLSIVIFLIPIIRKYKNLNSFLEFTGTISLFLFVVNGPLRYPFLKIGEKNDNALFILCLSIAFIFFTYFVGLILRFFESQMQEFISSGFKIRSILQKIKTNNY